MSRPNRRDVVDPDSVGVYHCYSRCAQGSYLCGFDQVTGTDYSHRKKWITDRQSLLVSVYAMELLAYAILDNHMHHVIRTRPDLAKSWTDEEVVRRWCRLHPQKSEKGEVVELTDTRLKALLKDEATVRLWRSRLASLSWYMKELKEDIAKRANRESGKRGHFFDARFRSPRLADVITLLLCLLYVDLNSVRAGIVDSPETYIYGSFRSRVRAYQGRCKGSSSEDDLEEPVPDATLQPIPEEGEEGNFTAPQCRPSDKGILPMATHCYFELVDWVGRNVRNDKRGAIPRQLEPILERIGCAPEIMADAGRHYERGFRRKVVLWRWREAIFMVAVQTVVLRERSYLPGV